MLDGVNLYATVSEKEYNETLKMVYSQLASEYISEPLASGYNQDIWYLSLIHI